MTKKKLLDSFDSLIPYNTGQEKNALIKSLDSKSNNVLISKILGYETLSLSEAEAYIYKLREISVGDIIETRHECKCGYQGMYYMSIPDMFFKAETENYKICDSFENIDDENINNKSLDEYNEAETDVEDNNKKIFDPVVNFTCLKCKKDFKLQSEVQDIISKYSIKNIFEQYLDISSYTNMTKQDTDSMIPYEREIFLGLIQKKEDDKGS